ncbi:hypothetical protein BLNAU_5935 [Blattamonas nauphoetae]|uniref:Uncharacterized protein n=1 Tax=Blattamonas nauphoetae TaxID=2049346 RepID=A0ABQ9Y5W9_9EUKA|nr:hypothetical protein BLNAU_5935 [Blattamonas nauphoetae]
MSSEFPRDIRLAPQCDSNQILGMRFGEILSRQDTTERRAQSALKQSQSMSCPLDRVIKLEQEIQRLQVTIESLLDVMAIKVDQCVDSAITRTKKDLELFVTAELCKQRATPLKNQSKSSTQDLPVTIVSPDTVDARLQELLARPFDSDSPFFPLFSSFKTEIQELTRSSQTRRRQFKNQNPNQPEENDACPRNDTDSSSDVREEELNNEIHEQTVPANGHINLALGDVISEIFPVSELLLSQNSADKSHLSTVCTISEERINELVDRRLTDILAHSIDLDRVSSEFNLNETTDTIRSLFITNSRINKAIEQYHNLNTEKSQPKANPDEPKHRVIKYPLTTAASQPDFAVITFEAPAHRFSPGSSPATPGHSRSKTAFNFPSKSPFSSDESVITELTIESPVDTLQTNNKQEADTVSSSHDNFEKQLRALDQELDEIKNQSDSEDFVIYDPPPQNKSYNKSNFNQEPDSVQDPTDPATTKQMDIVHVLTENNQKRTDLLSTILTHRLFSVFDELGMTLLRTILNMVHSNGSSAPTSSVANAPVTKPTSPGEYPSDMSNFTSFSDGSVSTAITFPSEYDLQVGSELSLTDAKDIERQRQKFHYWTTKLRKEHESRSAKRNSENGEVEDLSPLSDSDQTPISFDSISISTTDGGRGDDLGSEFSKEESRNFPVIPQLPIHNPQKNPFPGKSKHPLRRGTVSKHRSKGRRQSYQYPEMQSGPKLLLSIPSRLTTPPATPHFLDRNTAGRDGHESTGKLLLEEVMRDAEHRKQNHTTLNPNHDPTASVGSITDQSEEGSIQHSQHQLSETINSGIYRNLQIEAGSARRSSLTNSIDPHTGLIHQNVGLSDIRSNGKASPNLFLEGSPLCSPGTSQLEPSTVRHIPSQTSPPRLAMLVSPKASRRNAMKFNSPLSPPPHPFNPIVDNKDSLPSSSSSSKSNLDAKVSTSTLRMRQAKKGRKSASPKTKLDFPVQPRLSQPTNEGSSRFTLSDNESGMFAHDRASVSSPSSNAIPHIQTSQSTPHLAVYQADNIDAPALSERLTKSQMRRAKKRELIGEPSENSSSQSTSARMGPTVTSTDVTPPDSWSLEHQVTQSKVSTGNADFVEGLGMKVQRLTEGMVEAEGMEDPEIDSEAGEAVEIDEIDEAGTIGQLKTEKARNTRKGKKKKQKKKKTRLTESDNALPTINNGMKLPVSVETRDLPSTQPTSSSSLPPPLQGHSLSTPPSLSNQHGPPVSPATDVS